MAPRQLDYGMMIIFLLISIVLILLSGVVPHQGKHLDIHIEQPKEIKPLNSNGSLTLNGSLVSNVSIAKIGVAFGESTRHSFTPVRSPIYTFLWYFSM